MTVSVYFDKRKGKWHARVYHKRRHFHVGRFADRQEAVTQAEAAIKRMDVIEPVRTPANNKLLEQIRRGVYGTTTTKRT